MELLIAKLKHNEGLKGKLGREREIWRSERENLRDKFVARGVKPVLKGDGEY